MQAYRESDYEFTCSGYVIYTDFHTNFGHCFILTEIVGGSNILSWFIRYLFVEWSGEVRSITYSADGRSVSVVYRVTIYGTDAEVCNYHIQFMHAWSVSLHGVTLMQFT